MKTTLKKILGVAAVFAGCFSFTQFAFAAAPVLTLQGGNVEMFATNTYAEPGYSATDLEDGSLTGFVVVTGTVNRNVAGTYVLTYTVTDSNLETATATRLVRVKHIDSGHPHLVMQSWGLRGVDTPWIAGGTTVTDEAGISYTCESWNKMGCYDLTKTAWYKDSMISVGFSVMKNQHANQFPLMVYWIAKAR